MKRNECDHEMAEDKLGLAEYAEQAEQGDAAAQLWLGRYYDTERDACAAFYWYAKAAEQGVAEAQLCLGQCYFIGIGTEKNVVLAAEWYKKAAVQGIAEAQVWLSESCLADDEIDAESYKLREADRYYKKAEEYYAPIKTELEKNAILQKGGQMLPVLSVLLSVSREDSEKCSRTKIKEFLLTESGREMMDCYRKAAELGHRQARAQYQELQAYE